MFIAAGINETCTFHEECEAAIDETECKNNVCTCIFEKLPIIHKDGRMECVGEFSVVCSSLKVVLPKTFLQL